MHPLHQLQLYSAAHLVEYYVDYKYVTRPGYPFNKPVIRCQVDGVELDVLLDSGADISVLAVSWIVKHIKGPHLYKLDTAVACYPYDKNPNRWYNSATEAWKNVAVIRDVFYAEFKGLGYHFYFPIHAHPDDIPLFILGNDCLSLMDISINVATSTIRMPRFANAPNAQEYYQIINHQAEIAAGAYLNTKLAMLTAGRVSSISTSQYDSQNVDGVEVNHYEFLLYPTKAVNVFASQCVHLPCHTNGIPFRKNSCYSIRAVTRCPFGDLQVLSEVLQHHDVDSERITIPVMTETAVTMFP